MNNTDKFFQIAKHLGQLKEGRVKRFGGNEKGFAEVIKIEEGCSVWCHHTLDDRLTIDLRVTNEAVNKFPYKSENAVTNFRSYFSEEISHDHWKHSMDGKPGQNYLNVMFHICRDRKLLKF